MSLGWTHSVHIVMNGSPLQREEHKAFSQNHRMLGVGRDLCGSSTPTALLKQGHLQQAAQDLVQAGLEYLQRRRIRNLPGHLADKLRTHLTLSRETEKAMKTFNKKQAFFSFFKSWLLCI